MRFFALLVGVATLLVVNAVIAASVNTNITNVGSYGNGRLFVEVEHVINESGCAAARFDLEPLHPQRQYFLSLALSAQASEKMVRIKTNGCYEGFPTLGQTTTSYFYVIGG